MKQEKLKDPASARVSRHRKRVAASGARRVEVTVPSRDAPLVKAIAGVLRSDGKEAEHVRKLLQPVLTTPRARTGAEMLAFLRASPLTEIDLPVERDRSAGRSAKLG